MCVGICLTSKEERDFLFSACLLIYASMLFLFVFRGSLFDSTRPSSKIQDKTPPSIVDRRALSFLFVLPSFFCFFYPLYPRSSVPLFLLVLLYLPRPLAYLPTAQTFIVLSFLFDHTIATSVNTTASSSCTCPVNSFTLPHPRPTRPSLVTVLPPPLTRSLKPTSK